MASISFPSSRSCFCVVNPSPRSTNPPHLSNPPTNPTVQLWAHHHVRRRKVSVSVSPLPSPLSTSRVFPYHFKINKNKLSHVNFRLNSVNCFSERSSESETQVGSSYHPKISKTKLNHVNFRPYLVNCVSERSAESETQVGSSSAGVDGVDTGLDVECLVTSSSSSEADELLKSSTMEITEDSSSLMMELWEWALLISPFFFWGTAMVAMKEVLPKTGPFFISAFRLIPAGLLLVAFAASRGRNFPSGLTAWLSISLFALVDATCFQGFLAEGLERTSAGLGSVIIDSQPLTVAVLAALLFGESIGLVGAAGLVLGVIGLLLLEVPALAFDESNFSLWGSGEWWMLLAAQSMAVGTVMVRWVSKYSDPVMATGWHMVIGGLPLVAVSILNNDPALSGSLKELTTSDLLALLYTSIFGSAVSYGVFFYNATRGSLTKLSSLTFLTPMFASIFGFLYLGETFSPVQLVGAFVTLGAIYMVNYKGSE